MWIADGWKEYQVLDASGGEKLEKWGNYVLLRPDPQVIWNTEKKIPEWKKLNAHYHRSNKGGGVSFKALYSRQIFTRQGDRPDR